MKVDRYLPYCGIALGVAITILLHIQGISYTYVGVTISVFSLIYLLVSKKKERLLAINLHYILLVVSFTVVYLVSVLLLFQSQGEARPVGFFICCVLLGLIIGLVIYTKSTRPAIVMILLLAFLLRWSILNVYPNNFLGSDPQNTYLWYENLASGTDIHSSYNHTPLHLYLVVGLIKLGLATKWAMMFSLGVLEVLSLLFIYLLGKRLFNIQVGLLAMLILACDNLHTMWGWYIVAQSLGIFLFSAIVYPVITYRHNRWQLPLILVLIVLLTLSHSLSLMVTSLVIGLVIIFRVAYQVATKQKIELELPIACLLMLIITVAFWEYTTMLDNYIYMWKSNPALAQSTIPILTLPPAIASTSAQWLPLLTELNRASYYLLYGLSIVGLLFIWRKDTKSFSLSLTCLALSGVIFYCYFFSHAPLAIDRWFVFLHILLAVPCAVGILSLAKSTKSDYIQLVLYTIILFLLIGFSITSATAFDSPIYRSITMTPDWLPQ